MSNNHLADYLTRVLSRDQATADNQVETTVKPAPTSMAERVRQAFAEQAVARQAEIQARHIPPRMTIEEIFARGKPMR